LFIHHTICFVVFDNIKRLLNIYPQGNSETEIQIRSWNVDEDMSVGSHIHRLRAGDF
jgi:hypothetical protein